jgi:outer membrane protein OmpA-like peptidoglycan-associated protein
MAEQWQVGLTGHYAKYFNDNSILYTIDGVTQFPDKFGLSSLGFGLSITYLLGKTIVSSAPRVAEVKLLPKNKNIEVKVIDRETDKSLKNVQIYLSNEQGVTLTGITDNNGLFTFKDMPIGEYKIFGLLNEIETPTHEVFPAEFESSGETIQVLLEHHDPRFTLEGIAINKETNQPEGLVYIILNNTDKDTEAYTISDKKDGSFTYQLEPETDYTIYGRKNNFISQIEKITTKGLDRSKTLYYQLYIILEEARVGKTINLENIYYDFDKATIREDASKDLLKLVQFLEDNPMLKIELNSHTDSRGTAKYNDNLSQARAESVIRFLIRKGIKPNRLIAKGYGETRLVNDCADGVNCTEAEHQQNRRTEFMVVE